MRILYISQYFPPEVGGTSDRAVEMALAWVAAGHSVTVLCQVPNHPTGVVPYEYRGKLVVRERVDGIDVIRVRVPVAPAGGGRWRRVTNYLTFAVAAALVGSLGLRHRVDLVYATSPPLPVGAAALVVKTLRRIPLVFEVRDLWPEAAIDLGVVSDGFVARIARGLARRCYRASAKIVAASEGFRNPLMAAGVASGRLSVIPNGSNPELFAFDGAARSRVRRDLGLGSEFTAMFAGLHGLSYDLDLLLDTADRMRSTEFRLVLIGEGPAKAEARVRATRLGLENVMFLPAMPREAIPAHLSAADVVVVPHRELGVNRTSVPARVFDAMSCGRPVVLAGAGEAARVIETSGGGVTVPPEDGPSLVAALTALRDDPRARAAMGRRGRDFIERQADRRELAKHLLELLERVHRGWRSSSRRRRWS